MATIDFPTSLPVAQQASFKYGLLESKVQDKGEIGAARQRNRFTRTLERFSFSLVLTPEQKAALFDFYDTTLVRGVEAFNWTHPTTAVVFEVVFPARPIVTHLEEKRWIAELNLEEI